MTERKRKKRYPLPAPEDRVYNYEPVRQLVAEMLRKQRPSDGDVAAFLGCSERFTREARLQGLDLYRADRMAVALRRHPQEIWEEWMTPQAYYEADIAEGKISLEDALALVAEGKLYEEL